MFSSLCNPITLIEGTNLPTGIDLDRLVERDNVSYFTETLNFLLENRKEFNAANKEFYRAIVESTGNEEIIQESFADFFGKIKEIIDKLLEFIKTMVARFITALNRFVKSEKYLKKNAAEFSKFATRHEFRFNGYEFTFAPEIPAITAQAAFTNDFIFNIADTGNTVIDGTDGGDMKQAVDTLTSNIDNGNWYDSFRGKVIGKETPIYSTDFADELFMTFRNGDSSPEDIYVTSATVNQAYARFLGSDKIISQVKHTKSTIDSQYNSIKRQVEKMVSINYKDGNRTGTMVTPGETPKTTTLTKDNINNMDLFVKLKTTQVQEMSSIHSLAFAAKLDALNESYKQDKNLLYRALTKIQGSIKEV